MRKELGKPISLKDLTTEEMRRLWVEEGINDRQLAELFDVSRSTVGKHRRALGIGFFNMAFEEVIKDPALQEKALSWLRSEGRVNDVAKAVTHFAFRNGPVEDMHANGKLNQEDMKTLNKFMVNRLAYVFKCILDGNWLEFALLVENHNMYGYNWDEAIPDDGQMRKILSMLYKYES